jgi:hypothetical protein
MAVGTLIGDGLLIEMRLVSIVAEVEELVLPDGKTGRSRAPSGPSARRHL